ncbi:hypothetical protein N0V83_003033 [Neocucurbitaria cava]|uniref:Uncharacterized protein n=1 Tax=Neocucurbitaria cava TaxID=798079 RepID=A0A9W8YG27_9PLEO|nr:hypothetical protein N0V83_003033 [Neocucurbitaria cava]
MAAEKEVTFSPREMEVLAIAWQCMETQPKPLNNLTIHYLMRYPEALRTTNPPRANNTQVNMEKLARLTGYTPKSAQVTFGKITRKIKLMAESLSENGPATPKKGGGGPKATPTSTTSKSGGGKRTAAADNETPSKKQKNQGGGGARNKAKKEIIEHSEEEDEVDSFKVKDEEHDDAFFDALLSAAGSGNVQFGEDDE